MNTRKTAIIGIVVAGAAMASYAGWYNFPRTIFDNNMGLLDAAHANAEIPLEFKLSMDSGGVISGKIVSQDDDHIITSVVIHVRVTEKRKCGEPLVNPLSDLNWEENCKKDPSHTVDDTIEGQAYEVFRGRLRPFNQANVIAPTALTFDASKQAWNFFVLRVSGRPVDPLGIFSAKN
jgi:hypothetical protein